MAAFSVADITMAIACLSPGSEGETSPEPAVS